MFWDIANFKQENLVTGSWLKLDAEVFLTL